MITRFQTSWKQSNACPKTKVGMISVYDREASKPQASLCCGRGLQSSGKALSSGQAPTAALPWDSAGLSVSPHHRGDQQEKMAGSLCWHKMWRELSL